MEISLYYIIYSDIFLFCWHCRQQKIVLALILFYYILLWDRYLAGAEAWDNIIERCFNIRVIEIDSFFNPEFIGFLLYFVIYFFRIRRFLWWQREILYPIDEKVSLMQTSSIKNFVKRYAFYFLLKKLDKKWFDNDNDNSFLWYGWPTKTV